jgi:hypothetical protein
MLAPTNAYQQLVNSALAGRRPMQQEYVDITWGEVAAALLTLGIIMFLLLV